MKLQLTEEQANRQTHFRDFADSEIAPRADRHDREERLSSAVIAKLAEQGCLGAMLSEAYGGRQMDAVSFGLLNEEIGRV